MASTTNEDYVVIEKVVHIDEYQKNSFSNVEEAIGDSRENPIIIDTEEPNSVTENAGTKNSQIGHNFRFHEAERLAVFEELFDINREEYWKQIYTEVEFLQLKEMVKEIADAMNNSNV